MTISVQIWIEPHERHEAAAAYAEWLTKTQQREITEAPDGALICLKKTGGDVKIIVVEEG